MRKVVIFRLMWYRVASEIMLSGERWENVWWFDGCAVFNEGLRGPRVSGIGRLVMVA